MSLRIYLYALAALALGALVWREHVLVGKVKARDATIAAQSAELTNAAKIIGTIKADAQLNQETSRALSERLAAIDRSREPVSVFCRPARQASNTAVPAESGASGRADAAAIDGSPAAPLRDIGAALEDVRVEVEKNNARAVGLQEWERARTH